MEELKAEKDGERSLFAQIVVISKFTKNSDTYPANSLKKTPGYFYRLWKKKYEKSTVTYLNLECGNVGLDDNCDLDTSVSYKKDNPLLKSTLQKKYVKKEILSS